MRKIGKKGLTLLGFQPRSKAIKSWYHVRNAQFIYPDEETSKGTIVKNCQFVCCLFCLCVGLYSTHKFFYEFLIEQMVVVKR